MNLLSSHKVSGLNQELEIEPKEDTDKGGASHTYEISHKDKILGVIHFQNKPINESGVNGISNEALLAIVENRLLGFQAGEFSCRENAIAITKIQEALMWLQKRTLDRVRRDVEGTYEK